jgi:hypothetical protein
VISAAISQARELGYDVIGVNKSEAYWMEAFLHPKQAVHLLLR